MRWSRTGTSFSGSLRCDSLENSALTSVFNSREEELADPTIRHAALVESLVKDHSLFGHLRIADAVAPVGVLADLHGGRITVSIDIERAEGRARNHQGELAHPATPRRSGRTTDQTRLSTGSRNSTSALLKEVREDPGVLIQDPQRDLKLFRIAATTPMGAKRNAGRGGFIDSVLTSIDGFYEAVVQQVRPWSAKAPQLPKGSQLATEQAGIDVTPPPAEIDSGPDSEPEMPSEFEDDLPAFSNDSAGEEVVSWAQAEQRLERERLHSDPAGTLDRPHDSPEADVVTASAETRHSDE